MEVILSFLGECWKNLGPPSQAQFDNAGEVVGWGPAARYLSRVLRSCLRFGVEPVLIPPASRNAKAASNDSTGGFRRACSNAATSN